MYGYQGFWHGSSWWWIFPVAMILFCFIMMLIIRRRRGYMRCCWPTSNRATDTLRVTSSDSAREILDKRYALGEIVKEEYEAKKRDIHGRATEEN